MATGKVVKRAIAGFIVSLTGSIITKINALVLLFFANFFKSLKRASIPYGGYFRNLRVYRFHHCSCKNTYFREKNSCKDRFINVLLVLLGLALIPIVTGISATILVTTNLVTGAKAMVTFIVSVSCRIVYTVVLILYRKKAIFYVRVRQRSTKKGRKGTMMGKWKPNKTTKTGER